jgi:tyrosine-protein kinase Etk/Wzc
MSKVASNEINTTIPEQEPHKIAWLREAMKWKKLIVISSLSIVIAMAIVAVQLPNHYTSTAVVLPPQLNAATSGASLMSQMSTMGAMAGAGASLGIKNPNDQQVALLKSRTVETAMVNRFQLKALYHTKYLYSACKKWERRTKADSGLKDGLIRLSVTDVDPHRAADMANAWVDEYRKLTATLAVTEASQRSQFYEQQLKAAKKGLVDAEEAMKQTQQRTGVIDIEGQDRTLLASAAVARGQLAAKQVEIKAMMQFASDHNPDLERAREELAAMQTQLAAMDASNNRKVGDLVVPKGNVSQATLDFERALREVKFHETVVELLTRQYEGARVDVARQGSMVEVVDQATPSERPSSHYQLWIFLGSILLALPLSVGLARAFEAISGVICIHRNTGALVSTIEQVWGNMQSRATESEEA